MGLFKGSTIKLKLMKFQPKVDRTIPDVFDLDDIFDDIAEYDRLKIWYIRRDLKKLIQKYELYYGQTFNNPWE